MQLTAKTSDEDFWSSLVARRDYDPKRDYVGPGGGVGSKLVPRRIVFDFNRAAFRHDYHYAQGGSYADRFAADKRFLKDMLAEVERKAPKRKWWLRPVRRAGRIRAYAYYAAVRGGGEKCFNLTARR